MNRWRCPPALTSPRVDLGIGDVRMGSVAHNSEIRNGLVAGGIGLVGGLGGGITTMAGPQVFPKAPTWIWESLFWLGIALFVGAATYLLYEYVVRPRRLGKPKVDPLQIIALTAAIVLAGALFLQLIRGPTNGGNANRGPLPGNTQPEKPRPEFVHVNDFGFDTESPLILSAVVALTTDRIRIYVDVLSPQSFSTQPGPSRTYIGEVRDAVKSKSFSMPLVLKGPLNFYKSEYYWGDPKENNPVTALNRLRLVVIGQSGEEQHYYFEALRLPFDGSYGSPQQTFRIVPPQDFDWAHKWAAKEQVQ